MSSIQLLHDATFYAMYIAAGLAVFVIIERQIFYVLCQRDVRELFKATAGDSALPAGQLARVMERGSVPVLVVRDLLHARQFHQPAERSEDAAEAVYIVHKVRVIARLWILDTVVTAAPLLGLVGTILGIIDTFAVLAASGISDPSGVSKGIGTALYATALGISIALFGLVFYNYLREASDRLCDQLKVLLLRAPVLGAQLKVKAVASNVEAAPAPRRMGASLSGAGSA